MQTGNTMSDVRSLEAFRKAKKKSAAAGKTLCTSGRHKWQADKQTSFDSQKGKLVTRYVCERCGATKTKAM
jgi:hypothetical protein